MTLLITGATGLVGQELMRFVLQQGHKVNYLTTSKSKVKSQGYAISHGTRSIFKLRGAS